MQDTIKLINSVLSENLVNKFYNIQKRKNFFWESEYLMVDIAKSDYEINGVDRQYPEHISLIIEDWKIDFQTFGGCGGRRIYREIDKNIDSEKYLALWSETMPAIRIKDLKKALEKICKDYIAITEDIKARGLSHY